MAVNEIEDIQFRSQLRFLLRVLTVLTVLFLIYQYADLHFESEAKQVTSIPATVSDPPTYFHGRKGASYHYDLKAKEYNCRFWIAYSALDVVENDPRTEAAVKSIQEGEKITLTLYEQDSALVNSLYAKLEVVGIATDNGVIFDADQIVSLDANKRDQHIRLAIIVLFVLLVATTAEYLASKKRAAQWPD